MAYNFNNLDKNLKEKKDWLIKELATIRTGRATSAILDSVRINAYGSFLPLNQVSNIVNEDPKTLRIGPYDQSQTKNIEKAIADADLGVSTSVDDKGLRVIFPELTSERRELLIKQAGKNLEEAKISIRKEREEVWSDIQSKEKSGEISEDDKFRLKEEMQKKIDALQKELEELTDKKEEEIKN